MATANPTASTPYGQPGPTVSVYVSGQVYGKIDDLISAVNDAVLNRDVTLNATNTTTGQQLVKS